MTEAQTQEYVVQLVEKLGALFSPPLLNTIEEVGIIQMTPPPPLQQSLSIALQQIENRVGLASWALNPIYIHCRYRVLQKRLADLAATIAILLASPDFLTAWNVRKQRFVRIGSQNASVVKEELHFSYLVLTRAPKSQEAWAHRSWLLRTAGLSELPHRAELHLAWLAASRVFSNYYATVHRVRILRTLDNDTLECELEESRTWLRTHARDSSGWVYHRALRDALSEREIDTRDDDEEWFSNMCRDYDDSNQNISIHRRWLSRNEQAAHMQPTQIVREMYKAK